MGNTFPTGGFNAANMDGIWQAMEQFRSRFEKQAGTATRAGRGEVRTAVLALLAEQPMHGYQIIHEIEERSGGTWKPSAGSVYPTLQLLADEGLISAEENNGRKIYSLTDEGRAAVADADTSAPWAATSSTGSHTHTALPKAGIELAQAAAQVGRTGSPEQIKEAATVLDDARRKLYSILAQD
ncbi:PadR family transcriptional regulator [Cryobacterium sp. M91]|uniref:PadR family transcriptional regulator n=1 Tax=Cryobacterium sp. M91 TaxID=2048294 RepID=UPI000CE49BAB|nr:PadR family transcriptional regulator [Cryobacterium sp. M91]